MNCAADKSGSGGACKCGPSRARKVLVSLAALAVAVALAAVLFLDSYAARLVSEEATSALGVTTKVSSAHIGLVSGRSTVSGVAIEQPEGFPKGEMLTLREGSITVGLTKLMGGKIVIDELTLTGITVTLDEANGKLNLEVVASNLSGEDASDAKATAPQTPGREVVIQRLTIRDIRVIVAGTAAKLAGKPVEVTIPDIVVTDLGTKTSGSDIAAEVSTQLISHLTIAIVQARIEGLPDTILSGLNEAAGNLHGALSDFADTAKEGLKKAAEGIGDAVKDLFKGNGK